MSSLLEGNASFISLALVTSVLLAVTRFYMLARRMGNRQLARKRTKPCRTLFVVGSGGHTYEMLRIVGGLNLKNYNPRLYVAAEGDKMSQDKVKSLESSLQKENQSTDDAEPVFFIKTIPRARKVMQSYFTSVFTTLYATAHSLWLVFRFAPDILLCNGPGTCIPVCFWTFILNFLGLRRTTIVYVESLCRVERLSLSGILLYYSFVANYIYVQWPQLKKLYPRTSYIGRVV